MHKLILKPGREKSLLRRHPWIFSGALAQIQGTPEAGDTVAIVSSTEKFLAYAAYSPHSQIVARAWDWNRDSSIDLQFFRRRLSHAIAARQTLVHESNAMRLAHSESDGLPGLIVDLYDDSLVMQVLSAGMERWYQTCADMVLDLTGAARVFERSDAEVRRLEGLLPRVGVLRGSAPAQRIKIKEGRLEFWVDVRSGQKTGFYLDQRVNRARVGELARDKEVLDCFCHSGGFALHALANGAKSVFSVDSSEEALQLAKENLDLNGLPEDKATWRKGDVFEALRGLRDEAKHFDLIILDPPKFAPTAAFARKAARGYKDINLLAFKLLRPGGLLATFSCSGGISAELFQKIIAGGALDAGVDAQIVEFFAAAPDHPVALNFPESAYLKGLLCRISG
ncbi:MAG TPA: class I SAM-dependent rRNA methyltransferase [Burkholderiales bacterium]|nr:class I SAM-dependent rRNA methyltransferase [Burkholderiales bacterium]